MATAAGLRYTQCHHRLWSTRPTSMLPTETASLFSGLHPCPRHCCRLPSAMAAASLLLHSKLPPATRFTPITRPLPQTSMGATSTPTDGDTAHHPIAAARSAINATPSFALSPSSSPRPLLLPLHSQHRPSHPLATVVATCTPIIPSSKPPPSSLHRRPRSHPPHCRLPWPPLLLPSSTTLSTGRPPFLLHDIQTVGCCSPFPMAAALASSPPPFAHGHYLTAAPSSLPTIHHLARSPPCPSQPPHLAASPSSSLSYA